MGISKSLAEFVVNTNYEDIPQYVLETQKKSVLDAIAITLGASTLGDGCREMVELAAELSAGADGVSTVMGFGYKLPAVWAAFANASMAHSLDFGDTQLNAVIHSNASHVPSGSGCGGEPGQCGRKDVSHSSCGRQRSGVSGVARRT